MAPHAPPLATATAATTRAVSAAAVVVAFVVGVVVVGPRSTAALAFSPTSVVGGVHRRAAASSSSASAAVAAPPLAAGGGRRAFLDPGLPPSRRSALCAGGTNDDDAPNPFGGLTLSNAGGAASDSAAVLSAAFESLDDADKYDAVLTGLCAKILDTPGGPLSSLSAERQAEVASGTPTARALTVLDDPLELLEEMTGRSIPASPRSLTALVDAAAGCEDPGALASVVSACRRNGGLANYGSLMGDVCEMPWRDEGRAVLGDGTVTTKKARLEKLPDVPEDERGEEVFSALVAGGVVTFCLGFSGFSSLFGMEDLNGVVNAFLTLTIGVFVVDNFYDAIRMASNLIGAAVSSSSKDKIPSQVQDAMDKAELPQKDQLPLGLGSGALTGTVVRGFNRLLSVDTERECSCEAAAFFVAYALGLPCFAFRPNALEAAVLIVESVNSPEARSKTSDLDPLFSDAGVLKVLIWLMAPVAAESARHAVLISSDPREGPGLLKRLREKGELVLGDSVDTEELSAVLREPGGTDERDLLRWAYGEADVLLRNNRRAVEELTERLAGGAATVGDCVASLEGW